MQSLQTDKNKALLSKLKARRLRPTFIQKLDSLSIVPNNYGRVLVKINNSVKVYLLTGYLDISII